MSLLCQHPGIVLLAVQLLVAVVQMRSRFQEQLLQGNSGVHQANAELAAKRGQSSRISAFGAALGTASLDSSVC